MARRVKPKPAASRRDRAQATRRRMLRAAHQLFCERGYTGTRMSDVAEAAGVAVQTVYFTFHTKAELLKACYDRGVLGDDDPLPPPLQPWYLEMLEATDAAEAARRFAAGNGSIVQRVAVLDEVVRSAVHEPDAVAVHQRSEQLRRDGYGDVIAHFKKRFGLRAGLTARRATDLLLLLGGAAVYRTLVVDYGWSHDQYVDWVSQTIEETILREVA